MKTGDVYIGKSEGLAQWSDYPKRIRLIREITAPYSNQGQWEAVSYYTPKYANNYEYVYEQELVQVWTVEQIRATFQV